MSGAKYFILLVKCAVGGNIGSIVSLKDCYKKVGIILFNKLLLNYRQGFVLTSINQTLK